MTEAALPFGELPVTGSENRIISKPKAFNYYYNSRLDDNE